MKLTSQVFVIFKISQNIPEFGRHFKELETENPSMDTGTDLPRRCSSY